MKEMPLYTADDIKAENGVFCCSRIITKTFIVHCVLDRQKVVGRAPLSQCILFIRSNNETRFVKEFTLVFPFVPLSVLVSLLPT